MRSLFVSPGLNPSRMLSKTATAIDRCALCLKGFAVVTEAATGPYAITPVMAAMAGAEVFAVTRTTSYGTVDQVRNITMGLAGLAGVAPQVRVFDTLQPEIVAEADIVTNSGHVRPINAEMVARMKSTAVIPLMYEEWEFREGDLDLGACRRHGIGVAGTNERHPEIGVFPFLGMMAVKLLLDAGIPVFKSSILLLCNNPFAKFIEDGLQNSGAAVISVPELSAAVEICSEVDAILVALRPKSTPVLDGSDLQLITRLFPGAVVVQFWGDLDRRQLAMMGIAFWPNGEISTGHMGILPSAIGPEPVIQLQCGGLKVGEVMATAARRGQDPVEASVASGFGQALARHLAYSRKPGM
jgi:hypothetical protein